MLKSKSGFVVLVPDILPELSHHYFNGVLVLSASCAGLFVLHFSGCLSRQHHLPPLLKKINLVYNVILGSLTTVWFAASLHQVMHYLSVCWITFSGCY